MRSVMVAVVDDAGNREKKEIKFYYSALMVIGV